MSYMLITIKETKAAALENGRDAKTLPKELAKRVAKFDRRANRFSKKNGKRFYQISVSGSDLSDMQTELGTDLAVLGSWDNNGLQEGLSYDKTGKVVGTPVHPIDEATIIANAPIRYDETGKALPSPTTIEEALARYPLFNGQKPRKI